MVATEPREMRSVGQRLKRIDSPKKLTGEERFTGDLRLPGMLHARLVGSPYAHATINGIDTSAALAIPGVVAVLLAGDLPVKAGENPLASTEAIYNGQPLAIVLAESDAIAEDAVLLVDIDAEPLAPVTSIEEGLREGGPQTRFSAAHVDEAEAKLHNSDAGHAEEKVLPANVTNEVDYKRGDVATAFAEADAVVELTFFSEPVHQGYIEPQVTLVAPSPLGKLDVYTSTQGMFVVQNKVAQTLGLDASEVEVHQMPVGGGFGGKFGLNEAMVALAAVVVNRPVLLQLTRMEDFLSANPAPACEIRVKLGGTSDGFITALEADLTFLAGIAPSSPLGIAAILVGGYYRFPNLDITGREIISNRPKSGAYRAPGAQQASLAIEGAVDELARALGKDPMEFRIQNCAVEGDERPNGGAWPRIGLKETLEAIREHPIWQERDAIRQRGHGIGIGVGGWPGGLEPATAICRLDADGKLTMMLGSVDLNGSNTGMSQIAAEALGIDAANVNITVGTSTSAPWSGSTGGSKITYTVGAAVQRAAEDARQQILEIAARKLEASAEDLEIADGNVQVKGVPSMSISLKDIAEQSMAGDGGVNPVLGRGASAITQAAPGFAVHMAEVSVDELTGETTIHRYVAAQDVGQAINPALVEDQIHGGVGQGIGWALYEGMAYDSDGQLMTASLMDYAIPKAEMIPNIEIILVQVPSEHGPYGAKGIGEPPAVPGAAVITNAIRDATGIRVTHIPVKPEVMARALDAGLAAD